MTRAQAKLGAHTAKLAWIAVSCLLACAPVLPPDYVRARDAAEADYEARRFDAAGRRWLDAAQSAKSARDRSEARYRAAASFERAGQLKPARDLYEQLARGQSERAPRASFALAELRLQSGDLAGGSAELEAAIRRYPSSGVSNVALRRYFALLFDRGGDQAVIDYIEHAPPELTQSELAEQLAYERARRYESLGELARARDGYADVARRFAYPYGAFWDDALFHAADCEVRLEHPDAAIELLQRMLAARETAHLSGSYERPRFAEAAFRLAELYRDARHDEQAARRAFHAVFLDFPTSTLRDDALWQEALLAHQTESDAACAPLSLLLSALPESRYVPCAHEMCTKIARIRTRECKAYIEREVREALARERPARAQ